MFSSGTHIEIHTEEAAREEKKNDHIFDKDTHAQGPNVEFRRAPLTPANLTEMYRVAWNALLGRGEGAGLTGRPTGDPFPFLRSIPSKCLWRYLGQR